MVTKLWKTLFHHKIGQFQSLAEVFRENAEAASARDHALQQSALAQLAAEFTRPTKGGFDRFMDGLNRLPRPMLALGTIGLMVAAMGDPYWFASRMQGLALVPEPLWWLLGIIVSFYFGARVQVKSQEFHRQIAADLARTPEVLSRLRKIKEPAVSVSNKDENPALQAWKSQHARGT